MKNEYLLLQSLSRRKVTIFELSRTIPALDILEAEKLGLVRESHDNYCSLTSTGRERLMHLLDVQTRLDQQACEKAEAEEKECSLAAQAVKEKRKDRRHDYIVAAFSAVVGSMLTLFIEHADNIFHSLGDLFQSLFH